jgi:hypothetical protein
MSHTSGPWRLADEDGDTDILSQGGEHVVCMGHDYDEYGSIANQADRILIAAAPDLLAACYQAVSVLKHFNYINGDSVEQKQIEAAIAKAEGKS